MALAAGSGSLTQHVYKVVWLTTVTSDIIYAKCHHFQSVVMGLPDTFNFTFRDADVFVSKLIRRHVFRVAKYGIGSISIALSTALNSSQHENGELMANGANSANTAIKIKR